MKKQLKGTLCLLIATVIWGSTFIAQSVGMDYIGPFTFQASRSTLAVLFLLPVIFLFDKDKKAYFKTWSDKKLWKTGLLCGVALFIAAGLQQVGLQYTTAGKGGFITTMYVVLVPVLGFFLRKKVSMNVWISVALSVVGLYLLSCAGVTEINKGDLMMLGCALGFTVQITLVDELAGGFDGLRINCIQTLVTAVLSAIAMFLTETPLWSNIISCWFPLCYAGILSMGVAYSLQIIGQKHLDPTPASLIMGLESAFALLFGWLLLHERLSAPELVGCGLVFIAVTLSQLPDTIFKKKKHG